jgi:hypothetical protein
MQGVILSHIAGGSSHFVSHVLFHAATFANGGGPCYVVSIGADSGSNFRHTAGLAAAGKEDEPTLLCFLMHLTIKGEFFLSTRAALAQCNDLKDRFTLQMYSRHLDYTVPVEKCDDDATY